MWITLAPVRWIASDFKRNRMGFTYSPHRSFELSSFLIAQVRTQGRNGYRHIFTIRYIEFVLLFPTRAEALSVAISHMYRPAANSLESLDVREMGIAYMKLEMLKFVSGVGCGPMALTIEESGCPSTFCFTRASHPLLTLPGLNQAQV